MDIFCMSCGLGTSYKEIKPKFCSHCGKSYSPILPSPPVQAKRTPKLQLEVIEDEEEVELYYVPEKLSYDSVIIKAERPGLGSIADLAKGKSSVNPIKTNLTEEAVKESLSTFYKFAKNSTQRIDMGGNDNEE